MRSCWQVEALLGSGHERYLDEAAGRLPRVELINLLVEVDG